MKLAIIPNYYTSIVRQLTYSILLFFGLLQTTYATTRYVTSTADTGPGTVRDVVALSATNDTVFIDVSGVINITGGPIVISNVLTIIGPSAVHLEITRSSTQAIFTVGTGATLNIESVAFRNVANGVSRIIEVGNSGTLNIAHCLFENNSVNCIRVNGTSSIFTAKSCSFINNYSAYNGVGVSFTNTTGSIENCTFANNSISGTGNGVAIFFGTSTIDLTNNTFVDNLKSGVASALWLNSGANVRFRNNIIYNTASSTTQNITTSGGVITSLGGNIGNEIEASFTHIDDDMGTTDPGLNANLNVDGWGMKYYTFMNNLSPAIDVSTNISGLPLYDARRVWRVQEGGLAAPYMVDAGAIEYSQLTVTNDLNSIGSFEDIMFSVYPSVVGKRAVVFEIASSAPISCTQSIGTFDITLTETIINGFSQMSSRVPGPGTTSTTVTPGITAIVVYKDQFSPGATFRFNGGMTDCIIAGISINDPVGIMTMGIDNQAVDLEISGCHIGVNAFGTDPIGLSWGIVNSGNGSAKIGSGGYAGALYHSNRNVISSNTNAQILHTGDGEVYVEHNYIGFSSDGITEPIGTGISGDSGIVVRNTTLGRVIMGGADDYSYNVIGCQDIGVFLGVPANEVYNNRIGSGFTADYSNSFIKNDIGILITGTSASNNIIGGVNKGNTIIGNGEGIVIENSANTNFVYSNNIGVSIDGDIAVGNISSGVSVKDFGTDANKIGAPGLGNVISNSIQGITVYDGASGNLIQNNFVGLSKDGTFAAMANTSAGIVIKDSGTQNNIIGGTGANEGNYIGYNAVGILLTESSFSSYVDGNYIGLQPDGVSDMGNTFIGVSVNNSSADNNIGSCGVGNYISYNDVGIYFEGFGSDYDTVMGNKIGLDINANNAGNISEGIKFSHTVAFIVVGDEIAGCGNEIAYNGEGILTDASAGSNENLTFSGNSLHDNTGIGIDLDGLGYNGTGSANPPYDNLEPQTNQILNAVSCGGGNTFLNYVSDNGDDVVVEVFKSSDNEEGDSLIGQFSELGSTPGTLHSIDLGATLSTGMKLVATYTYNDGSGFLNTSEYSNVVSVIAGPVALVPAISNDTICENGALPDLTTTGFIGTPIWYEEAALTTRIVSGDTIAVPSSDATNPITHDYFVVDSITGCVGPVSSAINLVVIPTPDPSSSSITDLSGCNGAPVNIAFSLTPGDTAHWTMTTGTNIGSAGSGTGNSTFTASAIGTAYYNVSITDSLGCTSLNSYPFEIEIFDSPLVGTFGDASVCEGDTYTLSSSGNGGSGSYSFGWLNGAVNIASTSNHTLTNIPVGTMSYQAFVIDNISGCGDTSGLVNVSGIALPSVNYIADKNYCDNEVTAAIPVSSTQDPTVDYTWANSDPSIGLASSGTISGAGGNIPSFVATNSTSTAIIATITVSPTNSFGCTGPDSTFTITVNPLPSVSASLNYSGCSGDSIKLIASSGTGYIYSWLASNGYTSLDQNPVIEPATLTDAGTYTVTADDGTCTADASIAVAVTESPLANAGADTTICAFTSAVIDGSGSTGPTSFTYSWNPGSFTTASATVTPATTTSYVLTVADGVGCIDKDTVIVTVNTLPTVTIDNTLSICEGDTYIYSANVSGNGPFIYDWQNSTDFVNSTIEDATTIALNAGSYSHTLTVTDANLCTQSAGVSLLVNSLPVFTAATTDLLCNGSNDGEILFTVSSGVSPYQYSIDGGTNFASTVQYLGLGASSYVTRVVDQNGCISSDSTVIIYQPSMVLLNEVTAPDTCSKNVGEINLAGTGGDGGPYDFSLDNGINFIGSSTISGLSSGSYNILAQDAGGCLSSIYPITVTDLSGVSLTLDNTNNISCNGLSDGEINVTVSNPAAGSMTHTWTEASNVSYSANTANISGLEVGTYTLVSVDAYGCDDTLDVTIIEPTLITANFTATDESCSGLADGTLGVNSIAGGASGYSTSWTIQGGGAVVNSNAVPGGNYVAMVMDANNCFILDTITVLSGNVVNAPTINQSAGTTGAKEYCENTTGVYGYLSAISNTTSFGNFNWSIVTQGNNVSTNDSLLIDNSNINSNWIFVTETTGGCTSIADSIAINLNSNDLTVDDNLEYCVGVTYFLEAIGSGNIQWQADADIQDATVNPIEVLSTGDNSTYYVQMISNGCIFSDSIIVKLAEDCGSTVVGNNAFSPDGDGVNDVFQIDLPLLLTNENKVTILNRWGDVINEYENYNNQEVVWDGKNSNGQDIATGTYFYVIEIPEVQLKTTGWIQIVR